MRFYGLLDHETDRVVQLCVSRERAGKILRRVLEDEPDWRERLELVFVDFSGSEPRVVPFAH